MKLRRAFFALFVSCVAYAAPLSAQPKKNDPKLAIDAATIAKYESLGAEYGLWVEEGSGHVFHAGRNLKKAGLPGFLIEVREDVVLPDANVPFGLFLHQVTDASLKKLAPLRNLALLTVVSERITDVSLKEIGRVKSLKYARYPTIKSHGCGPEGIGRAPPCGIEY